MYLSHRPTLDAMVEGFERAWSFFGGIFRVLDNARSVITLADPCSPGLSPRFLAYSQDRGFVVDATRVRSPRDKPHVERMVHYVQHSFWQGDTFYSLEEAQERAERWCREVAGRRIHGTTRKRPLEVFEAEEQARLLAPHRVRQGAAKKHDGHIMTDAPNVMWGKDGTRVFTVDDGWVWVFAVVEHWNAECLGWHVCKVGNRFNALQPVGMAIQDVFGAVCGYIARGVALRMDHGTQYLYDHFLNQIRFWGLAASFAFVEEPQTNGVAERFNRTLKEQAIHGHVFQNIEEVRQAVHVFVEVYNEHWRVEKLGFRSPAQMRREWFHVAA